MDIDEQGQPGENCMSPLIKYLRDEIMPTEKKEVQQLQRRAAEYVEAVNKIIKRTLKTRLEKLKGLWAEELPNALWAYRTTSCTSTKETPFSLSFGSKAMVPVEIGLPSPRVEQIRLPNNNESVQLSLDLLEEHRETARLRTAEYKNRIARYYNSKVKKRDFKEGDLVLRKIMPNTKDSTSGAFRPTWEGPYKVTKVVRTGTYALEDQQGKALLHPWHAQHLKRYYH
ncbi:uncharacterized protein LOC111023436 [Momordica charantia]|uniref:Uncharacterized protein LOC111023436 n=1 Tax=Momordica charantia TaxID=3673 RepID=A0A6J1DVB6_MOMCH|nr:uncharacterized protein LOC111023436 [Momordica charantia]